MRKLFRHIGRIGAIIGLLSCGLSLAIDPTQARQPSEASNANSWSNEFAGFGINADTRGLSHPLVWNNTLYAAAIDGSSMTDLTGVVYWDGRQWLKLGALNGYVEALTIHQNKLYAGGVLKLNGQDVDLAYWDGTTWTGLATVLTNNYLMSLASYQNELYLTSTPLTIDGQAYQNIARWNGSEWNPVGSGVDGTIFNIISGADGIYVSGSIEPINPQNQGGIVRWDGNQWHDVGGGITGYIMDLQLVDNQVIIGGTFTSTTNLQMHNIAAWNGTTWNTFGNGIDNPIESVLLRDQGLYALGKPIGIDVPLYVWHGSDWVIAAQASYKNYEWLEFPKYSLVEFDNDMYALGDLYIYDQYYALNRLVWRDDHWESMTPNGFDSAPLNLSNVGETIYGYARTRATWGSGRGALIRSDVTTGWQTLIAEPVASGMSNAEQLEVISDTIFLIQANKLYQTTPVTTTWASVSEQTVFGMIRDQGKLYVAGDFSQFAGVQSENLVVWHNGQWQALSTPASFNQVNVVEVLNGVVYISDGAQLARWDGTQWQTLATGVNRIRQLEASADGVYVAGTFSSIAGISAYQIAYWNGSRWSALNGMINGPINDLEMGVDGLYVAGSFNGVAGGVVSPGILRWNGIWNSVGGGVQHRDQYASGFTVTSLVATPTRMYLSGVFDSVGNTYESSRIAAWTYGEPSWVTPTYEVYAPLTIR